MSELFPVFLQPTIFRQVEIPPSIVAYKYTSVPANPDAQALTADQLRSALGDIDDVSLTDDEANELILTAQLWAENYAGFILFTSVITTFRNGFPDIGFQLRRYPIQPAVAVSINYLIDQVLTTVSTDVFLVAERIFYSILMLKDGEFWPVDGDVQADSVKIVFNAGFGDDATSLPRDIVAGIKALAVYLFENPGDCNSCAAGKVAFPPEAARLLGFRKPIKV